MSKKKVAKILIDDSYESPCCDYTIEASKLVSILQKISPDFQNRDVLAKLFTKMKKFEDYSDVQEPIDTEESIYDQNKPSFDEKIVKALFWVSKSKKYQYFTIKLAPSTVKKAGMGAYALEDIPKGAKGVYKGIAKTEDAANMYYSWAVKSFKRNGKTDKQDETLYYVDASDLNGSNWTRFVNCGLKSKVNNLESDQLFDTFFYITIRDIEKGEELFIDYGEEYRQDNLGMKSKY